MGTHEPDQAVWRTSSRSNGNGGNDCIEVASVWRKASRSSNGNGGNCVEVSIRERVLAARDSG